MGVFEFKTSTDYRAAHEGVAYFPQPAAACLRLGDQDRLDFLQRQTTNDLSVLVPGQAVLTVLVSPTARTLDVLHIIDREEELLLLTLPGHGENTFNYLRRRIFFNDKVHLEDASREFSQIDLEGPGASVALNSLGFGTAPQMDEVLTINDDGAHVIAVGVQGLTGLGVRLVVPAGAAESIEQALLQAGAERISTESREILRIEAGMPGAGAELVEEYTPLEVGLQSAVSGEKGCYPGQEVLARQITYDKVTRQMVGLRLGAPAQPGTRLLADGAAAGEITSAAVSPRFGPIALGVIKRPHYEVGTRLQVDVEEQVTVEVVTLPFQE
jgi:folate-binding protein YgfZ